MGITKITIEAEDGKRGIITYTRKGPEVRVKVDFEPMVKKIDQAEYVLLTVLIANTIMLKETPKPQNKNDEKQQISPEKGH